MLPRNASSSTMTHSLSCIKGVAIACAVVSAYNDAIIAVIFAIVLQRQKNGYQRTTNMINKIVRSFLQIYALSASFDCILQMIYAVNTGFITMIFGVASLMAVSYKTHHTFSVANAYYYCLGCRSYSAGTLCCLCSSLLLAGGCMATLFLECEWFCASTHMS